MNARLLTTTIILIALGAAAIITAGCRQVDESPTTFADRVSLEYLGQLAVHSDGRVKSYGSFARSMMQFVSGPRVVRGQSPAFTYMDLMLRPRAYEDADIIYVKNKPMRESVANALRHSMRTNLEAMWGGSMESNPELDRRLYELEQRLDVFMRTGLIAPRMLNDPAVVHVLDHMRQDLLRTARFVEEVDTALAVTNPNVLRRTLRLIPPPGGGFEDPWLTFEDLAASLSDDPHAHTHHRLASVDMELKTELLHQWESLQTAWRSRDADGVNAAAAQLAVLLPQVNPELYPGEGSRTGWPWSLNAEVLDWKWITTFTIAGAFLALGMIGVGTRRPTIAALSFTCAFSWAMFLGATLMLGTTNPLPLESWYFAARNMTWVWVFYAFSLVPLLLSVVFRWKGAHWLGMAMFLGAFGLHTAALLIRWYVSDRWPNSNMFEAVTTAAWFGGCCAILLEIWVRKLPLRSVFALGSAAASMIALMCAYFMPVGLDPNIRNMMPVLHDVWLYIHTNVIILSYTLIFMAAVSAALYLLYRFIGSLFGFSGPQDYARVGGAAAIIQTTPDGTTYIEKVKSNIAQVLDGTTMILMEMAFVLLWAGIVMGAIWADHSWGRPWGWDPKEVFSLNTFIVFLVLIHGRLKAKDKGIWTACTALLGAAVMLFNWIAINFVVVGLHSYA